MPNVTDWVSAVSTVATACGVFFAYKQLRIAKEIAQLQFEDGLAREYRDLASKLPTQALLGGELLEPEYIKAFDELFHYIDLSNEQVSLRQRGRISAEVWTNWCLGIEANLALPAFNRAWLEIQAKCKSFPELRRLESEHFAVDPTSWKGV
jgi:hypothetical protein